MDRESLIKIIDDCVKRYKQGPRRYLVGHSRETDAQYNLRTSEWRRHLLKFIKLTQEAVNKMEIEDGSST